MTTRDIERYFRLAATRFPGKVDLLLFGGGAAIILSRPRETLDLDMEIQLENAERHPALTDQIIRILQDAGTELNIGVQAGLTVHRWSMIDWGDYRNHQRLWKEFGGLKIHLLEPEYFALTQLMRASPVDVEDIRRVLSRHKASWQLLAEACGRALRESPQSTAQDTFRRIVEHFLITEGPGIWGEKFKQADALNAFKKACSTRPMTG